MTTGPRIETIVADYIANEPNPGLVGKARRIGKQPALRNRTLIRIGAIAAGVAAATGLIGGGVYLAASNNAQSSPVQPASLTSQPSNPAGALPSSTAPAAAPPPDTAPIQGTGMANQDPAGSCSGRPNTITFPATVQIQGGVLHITDPGGETSGAINADGTADLNGQSESYHLLSSQGTTLQLREVNGGCSFLTTIVLDRVLFQVVPEPTQTSAPTIVVNAPGGVIAPETSGGQSLWWLWGAGIVVGIVLVGGGWWYYYWYEPGRGGAPPDSGFDPVPPTEGSGPEDEDRQEIG